MFKGMWRFIWACLKQGRCSFCSSNYPERVPRTTTNTHCQASVFLWRAYLRVKQAHHDVGPWASLFQVLKLLSTKCRSMVPPLTNMSNVLCLFMVTTMMFGLGLNFLGVLRHLLKFHGEIGQAGVTFAGLT